MFTFHQPPYFFLSDLDVSDAQVSEFVPLYLSKQFSTQYQVEKQPLHYENRLLVEKNDFVLHLVAEQGRVIRVEMARVWDTLYYQNGTPIGMVLLPIQQRELNDYYMFTQFNHLGEEEKYFCNLNTLSQKQIHHHTTLLWRNQSAGRIWLPEKDCIMQTSIKQPLSLEEWRQGDAKNILHSAVVRYAKNGQAACLFTVAFWLRQQGREQEAIHGLQKAAEKHFSFAWLELGFEYHDPQGMLGQHPEKSVACFRQAAYGGLPLANYQLALAHINGIGTEQSDTLAISHLYKAQEGGILAAALALGLYYRHGSFNLLRPHGSPYRTLPLRQIDHVLAAQFFYKASLKYWHDAPIALFYLAESYRTGTGVRQDKDYAKALYREAANLGDIAREEIQSAAYYNGDADRLQNVAENQPFAAYLLGKMYWYGELIPKNVEMAQRYLKIAAHSGHSCAEEAGQLLDNARSYWRNHHFLS